MSKLILLDGQIDRLIEIAQHEVFGHGARFREFGYNRNSFNFNLYPPLGSGSGFASPGQLTPGYKPHTSQELIVIATGGVDAGRILANNVSSKIMLEDTLHYREGLLYVMAQNDLLAYLWSTRFSKPENIKQ